MKDEHFSDFTVTAMHCDERFPVGEVCQTFIQAYPRRLFEASLFD